METKQKNVENHLKNVGSITSWDAILSYGVTRLSHIIYVLRNKGWIIETNNVTKMDRSGHISTFAEYKLKSIGS